MSNNIRYRIKTNYGLFTSFEKLNDFMVKNDIYEVEFIDDTEEKKDSKVIEFKNKAMF